MDVFDSKSTLQEMLILFPLFLFLFFKPGNL